MHSLTEFFIALSTAVFGVTGLYVVDEWLYQIIDLDGCVARLGILFGVYLVVCGAIYYFV